MISSFGNYKIIFNENSKCKLVADGAVASMTIKRHHLYLNKRPI